MLDIAYASSTEQHLGEPSHDTLAKPLFNNPHFDINIPPEACDQWQQHLDTSQLADLLNQDNVNEPFSDEECAVQAASTASH